MDIIAVRHAVEHARKWAVEGNGPLLLEFVTYQYGGHLCVFCYFVFFGIGLRRVGRTSDPGTMYRTREEVQRMRSTKDPIKEDVRKNWELHGYPDGRQEMSIGIGLPRWIVEGRNNIWVLSFYTLAFGGALTLLMVGQSLFSICLVTGGCVFHSGPLVVR
jgi:hypothetical protein